MDKKRPTEQKKTDRKSSGKSKQFKLKRVTKKQHEEWRVPVYPYLVP